MTNWTVSHTDRFEAAVSERSIVNWYSFAGVGDIAGWQWISRHDVGRGKDPWDAADLYLEKSPIHHAKNVSTPLLLIHSDSDWDCTLDHAEQLFVALKRLKKEAKLVIFPGENHYLSWTGRPRHRLERLHHYLGWFNDHLSAAESESAGHGFRRSPSPARCGRLQKRGQGGGPARDLP